MNYELLKEIWATTRRNRLRTTLTGFAVAWGIFMIIVLLGAGNGLINAQVQSSQRFIANSMKVYGGWTSKPYNGLKEGRSVELKNADIEATSKGFQQHIDEVGASLSQSVTISLGQQYVNCQMAGVYPNHPKIDKVEMMWGRFVNPIDMREKRKVVVLAGKQAKELDKTPQSLLGRHVEVGQLAFQVVGIYKDDESRQGDAFTPYTTLKAIYKKTYDADNIEFAFHGLETEAQNKAFEATYQRRLAANHDVAPDDESAFWLWNRYSQNLQMSTGLSILRTALWVVGLFTLLSGVVGVSNIMLITVKERTHEFGIRKAIGARPWSILKLIVTESVIITTFFGYIGMVLGIAANEYMDATLGHDVIDTGLFQATMFVNPTVGLDICIEATAVMVVAGTLAGLVPALKAARIRPIEALMAE